ncbi:uncharacterized protein BDZ99DRAFT_515576 [Mytilinidion resinicola]|uniref:Uncharacterized protein n=1 Tax=Mytilinidion resinicola TaxID=574789 RepID=A0A6A6Z123_9PEZI|nr:uncharacterized protein BDZ99DRAFT_515576 [Mytilinidion resinicola]KAF2814801.1 hypothetical protein BDZ99DRAFT_515576 [Mytilinidion resinicola]
MTAAAAYWIALERARLLRRAVEIEGALQMRTKHWRAVAGGGGMRVARAVARRGGAGSLAAVEEDGAEGLARKPGGNSEESCTQTGRCADGLGPQVARGSLGKRRWALGPPSSNQAPRPPAVNERVPPAAGTASLALSRLGVRDEGTACALKLAEACLAAALPAAAGPRREAEGALELPAANVNGMLAGGITTTRAARHAVPSPQSTRTPQPSAATRARHDFGGGRDRNNPHPTLHTLADAWHAATLPGRTCNLPTLKNAAARPPASSNCQYQNQRPQNRPPPRSWPRSHAPSRVDGAQPPAHRLVFVCHAVYRRWVSAVGLSPPLQRAHAHDARQQAVASGHRAGCHAIPLPSTRMGDRRQAAGRCRRPLFRRQPKNLERVERQEKQAAEAGLRALEPRFCSVVAHPWRYAADGETSLETSIMHACKPAAPESCPYGSAHPRCWPPRLQPDASCLEEDRWGQEDGRERHLEHRSGLWRWRYAVFAAANVLVAKGWHFESAHKPWSISWSLASHAPPSTGRGRPSLRGVRLDAAIPGPPIWDPMMTQPCGWDPRDARGVVRLTFKGPSSRRTPSTIGRRYRNRALQDRNLLPFCSQQQQAGSSKNTRLRL